MGDVRGKGLMVGVETGKGPRNQRERTRVAQFDGPERVSKGLLLLGCGESTVRFCPALIISREEVDTGLSIFEETMKKLAG